VGEMSDIARPFFGDVAIVEPHAAAVQLQLRNAPKSCSSLVIGRAGACFERCTFRRPEPQYDGLAESRGGT
jgi:hypothetical protein